MKWYALIVVVWFVGMGFAFWFEGQKPKDIDAILTVKTDDEQIDLVDSSGKVLASFTLRDEVVLKIRRKR